MHYCHSMEESRHSQKSLGFVLSPVFVSNIVEEKELNLKITKNNSVNPI